MGLKQDIVIVNEYTVKDRKTGKGSRGATPGDYVLRYMARELATETVAPIRRHRAEDFIVRYMAREDAAEFATDVQDARERMRKAQGRGGVAFGYGSLSLSDQELRAAAKDIQRLYDKGHTVMKTVLSFDEEYLRRNKLIPEDFELERKGDYRGQLDQMKLRLAITHGIERLNRAEYDDLRFTAVIQVDTEHVHCHLSMVDAGKGRRAKDGTQKGKITAKGRSMIRRGVDAYLDETQKIAHLSSAVGYERRNVVTYIKKWAHARMVRESGPQFLLACLPEDKTMWRASTNRAEMRKANTIVREMVLEKLEEPGSPMAASMDEIITYANERRRKEGLTKAEWGDMVDKGREQVITTCMNGVYGVLKTIEPDRLQDRTPMLDVMSMDYEELAQRAHEGDEDELVDFGFRLRSYSSRLKHHTEKRSEYHENARRWERESDEGEVSEASRALYLLYLEEEEYHARCAAKYRHFLRFVPPTQNWTEGWEEVAEYGRKLQDLKSMRKDQSLVRMKNGDEAEMRGREIYDQPGGRLLTEGKTGRQIIDGRIERMTETYARKIEDLRVEMAARGLRMKVVQDEQGRDDIQVDAEPEFDFEEVKGLDMHHMYYDFPREEPVGEQTKERFQRRAQERRARYDDAYEYLVTSDQERSLLGLPTKDLEAMEALAVQLDEGQVAMLPSRLAELNRERERIRQSRVSKLTDDIATDLEQEMFRQANQAATFYVDHEGIIIPDEGYDTTQRTVSEEGLE